MSPLQQLIDWANANDGMLQVVAMLSAAPVINKRPLEGIPELERSIALSPKGPALGFWLYALGSGYLLAGDLEKAHEQFQRSVKYDPKFAFSYLRLGWLDQVQGRSAEAAPHFARAKELLPDLTSEKAAVMLGQTEQDAGQFPL